MIGLFLFRKPKGITSRNLVNQLSQIYPEEKIGHAGTLDPLAEGLLILGVGTKFTKNLTDLQTKVKKEYLVTIDLSHKTQTFDLESRPEKVKINSKPDKETISVLIAKEFLGEIKQIPPLTSAKKIKGKRLYQYFREGELMQPKANKVFLYDYQILDYQFPKLTLKLIVSSGFYVRSFARDLGKKLNLGNLVTELIRTKQGPYSIEQAVDFVEFQQQKILLWGKISGKVHGVGFRIFLKTKADQLGLVGWVKNVLPNIIEFSAIGYRKDLEEFQKLACHGPKLAQINEKEFVIQKIRKHYSNFAILPTENDKLYQRFNL